MKIDNYLAEPIKWDATSDAEFPYSALLEGKRASIRLNDFPADNLYTLIIGDAEVDFDAWPAKWVKTKKNQPKTNGIPRGRLVKAI